MTKILVTGASGFVGLAVCKELKKNGYDVLGLVRSEKAAAELAKIDVDIVLGDVNDEVLLAQTISQVDGVIHTAFNHNFSTFYQNCQDDYKVIQVMGECLVGTDKPLVVTSGAFSTGKEKEVFIEPPYITSSIVPRSMSDESALLLAEKGVNAKLIGLTQVHNTEKFGLVNYLFDVARQKGISAYIGDGSNLWSGVHIDDAARLYRLVLECGKQGNKYFASAGKPMSLRHIAEIIGTKLSVPVRSIPNSEAESHFGSLTHLAESSLYVSENKTATTLGWSANGPSFAEDLANNMQY